MNKKEYKAPMLEVMEIESEDVMTSSAKKPTIGSENDNMWGGGIQSSSTTRTNFYDRYND